MSVITPPHLRVKSFTWHPELNQIVGSSVFGRQAIEVSTPLWAASMTGVPEIQREAVLMTTFLESLKGLRNQVELYNLSQPIPSGSMRGSMVLDANAADGATTLAIDAGGSEGGATLLRGDLLGLGTGLTQQVVRISGDAVADSDGVITVVLNTPLRNAFVAGTSVRWDKPKALFRQRKDNAGIEYVPGILGQSWALDLLEDPRP